MKAGGKEKFQLSCSPERSIRWGKGEKKSEEKGILLQVSRKKKESTLDK